MIEVGRYVDRRKRKLWTSTEGKGERGGMNTKGKTYYDRIPESTRVSPDCVNAKTIYRMIKKGHRVYEIYIK